MKLRQRAIRLEVLRPQAWAPEEFSPAAFPRLAVTSPPADAPLADEQDDVAYATVTSILRGRPLASDRHTAGLDEARTRAGAPDAVLVDSFQRRVGWPHPADAAPWPSQAHDEARALHSLPRVSPAGRSPRDMKGVIA